MRCKRECRSAEVIVSAEMKDRLVVASEAAFVLERMGFVACGRKKDGVVTVDMWIPQPNGTQFAQYEVDHDD